MSKWTGGSPGGFWCRRTARGRRRRAAAEEDDGGPGVLRADDVEEEAPLHPSML